MSRRKRTAFHEAAHAVVAHHSRFHYQCGIIVVTDWDGGWIQIALNRKNADELKGKRFYDLGLRRRIARDKAVIFCGGYVGEKIAEKNEPDLFPVPDVPSEDFQRARRTLRKALLSDNLDRPCALARELLSREWWAVERVAAFLLSEEKAEARIVREMIDIMYWQGEYA